MSDRIPLPCPHCSSLNEVELRQAGESITCGQCRQAIEVPTLRGLRLLAPAKASVPGKRTAGGAGQFLFSRTLFVAGLLACLLGLAVGGGLWFSAMRLETEPPAGELDEVNANIFSSIDRDSLTEFWKTWHEQIIARPPGRFRESPWAANRRIAETRWMLGKYFLVLVPVGVAAMIGSAFVRK